MRPALFVAALALAGCGSASTSGKSPKQVFAGTCGTCHTLAAAGTGGTFGPNLDKLKPSEALVRKTIAKGPGPMPANLLTGKQADAVARYVSGAAGSGR